VNVCFTDQMQVKKLLMMNDAKQSLKTKIKVEFPVKGSRTSPLNYSRL